MPIEEQRKQGFSGYYYRTGHWCLEHRWLTFAASIVFLVVGFKLGSQLKSAFFPIDLQFLSTVDIFLPNDSALTETKAAAAKAREIIEQQAHQMETEESDGAEGPSHLLKSLTTFVGGGGPRFWYSLAPENKQVNYAQVVIEIDDKRRMASFASRLQPALSAAIPGAYVDVQELQTNGSKNPIEIFVSGRAESSSQRRDPGHGDAAQARKSGRKHFARRSGCAQGSQRLVRADDGRAARNQSRSRQPGRHYQ